MARVSQGGKVTVPKRVRELLDIRDGDYVRMAVVEVVKRERRDLFIGASARAKRIPLVTRNVAHFQRIPGLRVITSRDLLRT